MALYQLSGPKGGFSPERGWAFPEVTEMTAGDRRSSSSAVALTPWQAAVNVFKMSLESGTCKTI